MLKASKKSNPGFKVEVGAVMVIRNTYEYKIGAELEAGVTELKLYYLLLIGVTLEQFENK